MYHTLLKIREMDSGRGTGKGGVFRSSTLLFFISWNVMRTLKETQKLQSSTTHPNQESLLKCLSNSGDEGAHYLTRTSSLWVQQSIQSSSFPDTEICVPCNQLLEVLAFQQHCVCCPTGGPLNICRELSCTSLPFFAPSSFNCTSFDILSLFSSELCCSFS